MKIFLFFLLDNYENNKAIYKQKKNFISISSIQTLNLSDMKVNTLLNKQIVQIHSKYVRTIYKKKGEKINITSYNNKNYQLVENNKKQ